MNDKTTKFFIFIIFSLVCVFIGYVSRKKNWIKGDVSRTFHLHTVIWTWAPIALISFLMIKINKDLLIFMMMQPIIMIIIWQIVLVISKILNLNKDETGVTILSAVFSNQGFTLGAYLCYLLLQKGDTVLGYGMAYVTSQQLVMIFIFYPVAMFYGSKEKRPIVRLISASLFGIRSIPLYAAVGGVIVNLMGYNIPDNISVGWILDLLIFIGTAGGYIGIGLRLRLKYNKQNIRLNLILTIIKFTIIPIITFIIIFLIKISEHSMNNLLFRIAFIESFMPIAIASVIVSNIFYLNAEMASTFWFTNTVIFCLIVLPILYFFI